MHEHKQNQCKRKVKHRKNAMKLIYKEKADSEDGYLGMYLFLMGKISGKDRKCRFAGILEKGTQPCIKKDSKPDAGWNHTGLRRKYNSLSDG